MTITLSTFTVILLLIILIVITEHLFNWWFRSSVDDWGGIVFLYLIKWVYTISLLYIYFS